MHSFFHIRIIALLSLISIVGCDRKKNTSVVVPTPAGIRVRQVRIAPAGAPLKFGLITNSTSVFWNLARKGVDQYHTESGVQVDVRLSGTVAEQNNVLEDMVSQGYNGIAISVIAPNDQVRELNRAAAATNLVCIDSDAPKSNRLVYIGTDNFKAGRVLGQQIVRLLPNGGKIAVFVGTFSADNAAQRLRGIQQEIAGHNIEIVAQKEDNQDMDKSVSNVEDVINSMPDVNLLCGLWSYNGPAIAKGIEASHKKGKILAAVFDEEADTLAGIENGVVACTVVQKPFMFGYLSSKMLDQFARGKADLPAQETIDTGVDVIDAHNVKDFAASLPK